MVFPDLFVGVKTFKKSVDLMTPLLLGEKFFFRRPLCSFNLMFWRLLAKAVMFMYKRLCEVKFCICVFYYFSAITIKSSEKGKFSFRFNDLHFFKAEVDRVQAHIGFESYPDREIDGCVFGNSRFPSMVLLCKFLALSSVVQISIARAQQPGSDICHCFAFDIFCLV